MTIAPGHGTTFYYNGVTLTNVLTDSITHDVVLDETGVNQVACRVEIVMTGIMHRWDFDTDDLPEGGFKLGTFVGETPLPLSGATMSKLRSTLERLNEPRKLLRYTIGSTPVYFVMPVHGTPESNPTIDDADFDPAITAALASILGIDESGLGDLRMAINHGPQVKAEITRVISDSAAWVKVTASFEYIPCGGETKLPAGYNNVLSLRWKVTDDIDCSNWRTKRVFSGTLRTKNPKYSPHLLRYLAVPPIDRGWKPVGMEFSESDDNAALSFSIAFEEISSAPPAPASDWSGKLIINAPMGGIGMKTIEMELTLTGPESVSKLELVYLALVIFDVKIGWYDAASHGAMFCRNLSVGESLHENVITASLSLEVLASTKFGANDGQGQAWHDLVYDTIGTTMSDPAFDGLTPPPVDPTIGGGIGSGSGIGGGGGVPLGGSGYSPPPPGSGGSYTPTRSRRFIPGYDRKQSTYWLPAARALQFLFVPPLVSPCRSDEQGQWDKIQGAPDSLDQAWVSQRQKEGDKTTKESEGAGAGLGDPGRTSSSTPGGGTSPIRSNPANSPYMMYDIVAEHDGDSGVRAYPIGAPANISAPEDHHVGFLQLWMPTHTLMWKFQAARINRWPVRPGTAIWSDTRTGVTFVPLQNKTIGQGVEVSVDGRKLLYRISGYVRMQLSRPLKDHEVAFVGVPPVVTAADSTVGEDPVYMPGTQMSVGSFSFGSPTPPSPPTPPVPPTTPPTPTI